MENKLLTHNYETKCRRCGTLHERDKKEVQPGYIRFNPVMLTFMDYIREGLKMPNQYDCRSCEKHTVQDIVSFKINK